VTPAEVAQALRRKRDALRANVLAAEEVTVKQAIGAAVVLSSGTLTEKDLAAQGHPYARRRPTSPHPEVINAQTGLLRASWRWDGPKWTGGGVVSRVYNTSREAGFMTGTRLMIPRPIVEAVKKKVLPGRARRLRKALKAALKA
jgi:hypothetical protein